MEISLENWLRNKLQENEEMQDYSVATDAVRAWIDEYNHSHQSPASLPSEWISVKDRLPENHSRVLCYALLENAYVEVVCLFDKDSAFYRWIYEGREVDVTYWAPIILPPTP